MPDRLRPPPCTKACHMLSRIVPNTQTFSMSFALQCVITIVLGWASFVIVSLLRRATLRHCNAVTARLDEGPPVDADAMARYRFTPSRLAKAQARLDSGTFDCAFVGSGPSAMACAAALSQIGYKVR